MLLTIVLFIIILGILIFVHEFGHFIAARRAGVKVEEFGFGFPPRIVGIKRKGTIYSLNWIPLGGFVKIKGEAGEYREDKDSFAARPIWQRGIILASGVAMNVVLAMVILSFGFSVGLPQAIDELPAYAKVREPKIQIVLVFKDSPAEAQGIRLGDTILEVDGKTFSEIENLQAYIDEKKGVELSIKLKRGQEELDKSVVPQAPEEVLPEEVLKKEKWSQRVALIGVALAKTGIVSYPPLRAIANGTCASFSLIGQIIRALWRLLRDLALGRGVTTEITGPVGIAVLTGQVARLGFIYILQFIALLSLNLAIINFLPFPALDGGRVLFLGIEALRRKPTDARIEAAVHNIGFALLMCLVVAITYRDIVRFGGRIVSALKRVVGG